MARVLIAEPSLPISAVLRKFLESARHEVLVVHSVAEAVEAAREKEPELVFTSASGAFDGEALCSRVKGLRPLCPVVVVYPPEEERPEDRAARAGAEAFLVAPLKRAMVVSTAQLLVRLAQLKAVEQPLRAAVEQYKAAVEQYKVREAQIIAHHTAREADLLKVLEPTRAKEGKLLEEIASLTTTVAELRAREEPVKARIRSLEDEAIELTAEVGRLKDMLKTAAIGPGGELGFLKRFLPVEVKRSKRYQYPVAVVLIGLDKMEERLLQSSAPEFQRAAIRSEVLAGIGRVVRDIDLTVPFADDKYLVLLPHTPRDGAMVVSSRLVAELGKMDAFDGGTASVGLASYEPRSWHKEHVSFGGLMREATAALLKAQANGGGYVEAMPLKERPRRDRISIG